MWPETLPFDRESWRYEKNMVGTDIRRFCMLRRTVRLFEWKYAAGAVF